MRRRAAAILAVASVGLLLSAYATFVELKKAADPGYSALCDLSEAVSCSKVFASEYGRIFSYGGVVPRGSVLDQPNAVYGIAFYATFLLLPVLERLVGRPAASVFYRAAALLSCGLSAVLAYLLVFILGDVCVVCVSSYVVNATLLLLTFKDAGDARAARTAAAKED